MKTIDRIIFNELSSRRAVVLPGVGTLGVARRAARMEGKEVKAPVNEVVFSGNEAGDAPSVIALMESLGLGGDAARTAYGEWLDGAREGDGIAISGVGAVKGGVFTPSPELDRMLNPVRTRKTAVPVPAAAAVSARAAQTPPTGGNGKRGNGLTNILLMIVIVLLLAVACLYVVREGCACCNDGRGPGDADAVYNRARGRTESERDAAVPSREVTPPRPESHPVQPQTQPAQPEAQPAQPEPQPAQPAVREAQSAQSASREYHVIAGSFVHGSNADRMIARYRRDFPDLNVERLDTRAWIMVSVWQGSTFAEGTEANRKLQERLGNHGMWVYRLR